MLRAIMLLFEGGKLGCRQSREPSAASCLNRSPILGRIRFRLLLLLILLAPSALCRYSFDSWTVDNGLPVNSVLGIVRGRDGYLWLLTFSGLVRFDGLKFQLFDQSSIPGLNAEGFVIFSLMEDSRGGIWAGTWGGGAVCYRNGSFRVYTTKDGLPNNSVVRIDEDAGGTVWIYTRPGLTKFKEGKLTQVAPLTGSPFNQVLTHPSNFSVEGYLWGLWRYSKSGWERFAFGKWSPFPVPPDIRDPRSVRFDWIAEDSRHRLWYRILKRPGDYFVIENGRLRSFHGIGKDEFICYQDRQGRLWTSNAQGQAAFREKGVRHEVPNLSTAAGFTAIEDPKIGLWIATVDRGLFHLKEPLIATQFIPGDLQKNAIQNLLLDRSGSTWIGSIGLTRWNDGKFRTFYRKAGVADGHWKNTVSSLFLDRDNTLWIGYIDAVARFENNRIVELGGALARIKGEVHVMHRDRSGGLWFGCEGAYRLHGNTLTHYSAQDGLAAGDIRAIEEGPTGAIWFAADHGLSCYRDGKFFTYRKADGLSSEHISAIYLDQEGALWIGTAGEGLNRYKDGRFAQFTAKYGFPKIGVSAIVDDGLGYLWIGSSLGLYRAQKKDLDDVAAGRASRLHLTSFGKADGLPDLNCSGGGQPRVLRARDGTVWFPTLTGLAVLNPRLIPRHTEPPRLYLTESLIDGKAVPEGAPLVIPPGEHNLEIHYTAVTFVKPEQVQFRYRLSGLDPRWTEVGTERAAYFTRLPAGRYNFEVQATNGDGLTNAAAPILLVTVQPRFYETWWFQSLCLSAATGLLYLAWQRRVRQLEKARAAQQAFSRRLMESQEAERKRIATELHDGLVQRLAVIRNLALLHLSANGKSQESIDRIGAISSEAGQAMSEVREISHNLRPHQLDLLGLTKAIQSVIQKVAVNWPITLTFELDNIDGIFEKESEINVYRIVQECLSNIVRHSQATEASVLVHRSEESIAIAIRDNGRGLPPPSASLENGRVGLGLGNISERAQLLGGRAHIFSEPGKGTEVRIVLELAGRTLKPQNAQPSAIHGIQA